MAETEKKQWTPRDLYQEVTDQIVAQLELAAQQKGAIPWRKPWRPDVGEPSAPFNGNSGHKYRGINSFLLGVHPKVVETGDPRFVSFDQAKEKGWGGIKKGEKAVHVVFAKKVGIDEANAETGEVKEKQVFCLRSYPVFHASQCVSPPPYVAPTLAEAPWRTPEAVEAIVAGSGIEVRHAGDKAYYAPSQDVVVMPPRVAFGSMEGYAETLLHELGHATGAASRLGRDFSGRFGSKSRAREELTAELCSCFVGREIGVSTSLENQVAYIQDWLEVLKDKKAFFRACGEAQAAADMVLGWHPGYAAKMNADKASDAEREAGYEARKADRDAVPKAPVSFDRVPDIDTAYRQMEQCAAEHRRSTPVWEASRRILMAASYAAMRDSPGALEEMASDPDRQHIAVQATSDAVAYAKAVQGGRALPPPGPGKLEDVSAEAAAVLAEAERRYHAITTTEPRQRKATANLGNLDVSAALGDAARQEAVALAAASEPSAEAGVPAPRM